MKTKKVYGPPGTGKTRHLLDLFERELERVDPRRVAFVTFTRAARLEALQRTKRDERDLPYLRTIHSICYRELGVTQGELVKPRELRAFGKTLGFDLSGKSGDPWVLSDDLSELNFDAPSRDDYLLAINHLGRHRKQKLLSALRDAPADLDFRYAKFFTESYRKWKQSESLVDWTDLLTDYLKYGKPLDVDVFFVDEAQDLSALQWDVVDHASANAKRVYLAGDDDQAIFSWAGASAALFNERKADFVEVLDRSYRCPRAVADVARAIIARVKVHHPKTWLPRDEEGVYREVGYLDESLFDAPFTYVLFRNHYRGRALAAQLQEKALAFLGCGSPLSNQETLDVLRGWRALSNDLEVAPKLAFAITHHAKRSELTERALGATQSLTSVRWDQILRTRPTLASFSRVLARLPGVSYLDRVAALRGFESLLDPKIALVSIHQSKGREAHTVVLDRDRARKTYDSELRDPDDEHRVWYVAATRARERLYSLTSTDTTAYKL